MEPPLPNSQIKVETNARGETLTWKPSGGGCARYGIALFLLTWMGGWAVGEVAVIYKLVQGGGPNLFLLVWLCGWTVGGLFAGWFLINLLRGPRTATLVLGYDELTYSPGSKPMPGLTTMAQPGQSMNLLALLARPKPVAAGRDDIGNLVMERVGHSLRLSFDIGAQRIEVGSSLGEPDKEWLNRRLQEWLAE